MAGNYAKVILGDQNALTFRQYGQQLRNLAGDGLDVGVTQVGVHEALLRPHIVRHLQQQHPGATLEEILVTRAGADRVEEVEPDDAHALLRQRVEEDLEPMVEEPVPAEAGGRGWHLEAVNVRPAWAQVGGPDGIDWQDIRIGQIDTGYTRHEVFGHHVGVSWMDADDARSFEPNPVGPPGVDPMPPGALSKGHGTRIGSVISGWSHLADGFAFHGAAPRVPHVMVRMTDSVAINTRQMEFIDAVDYLVNDAAVDVINVSLGIFPPVASRMLRNAMAAARRKGVIVVCAAGNDVDPVVMPAALDSCIAVAGVTWQSLPWHGSSFGPQVAFSAPAADIYRASPKRQGVGSEYIGAGSGTSYATAITTGAAALWLLRWGPQVAQKYGRTAARVEAFRKGVIATVRKPPGWQPQPFGAGILDIGRLCTEEAVALP